MKMNSFWTKLAREAEGVTGGTPAAVEPAPVVETAPDLSFIPADYHTDGKPDLGKFTSHYQELVTADMQRKEALAAVPEAYDFAVPADLKFDGLDLPEGFTVKAMVDDAEIKPLYDELGSVLKEIGAPAGAAGKVAGLLAKYEAIKSSRAFAAAKAEKSALGTPEQADARISAVTRRLDATLPKDQADALKSMTGSAKALQALEKLLGPTGTTPTPTPAGAGDDNLDPYERLKLANRARAAG